MMFRPNPSHRVARAFNILNARTQHLIRESAADAVLSLLVQSGIVTAAERENRRRIRHERRQAKSWWFARAGASGGGLREQLRRRRQIERGQLTEANGLVR